MIDAKPSETTDVYGLGALLFCMLTGSPPFGGANRSPGAVVLSVLNDPAPVGLLPDSVPESLGVLLLECLAKLPDQRPAGARALLLRLASVRSDGGLEVDDDRTVPIADVESDWTTVRPKSEVNHGQSLPTSSEQRRPVAPAHSKARSGSWQMVLMAVGVFVASIVLGLTVAVRSGW